MFGFSRRRMKLGRLKVHLSDAGPGTRSPIRPPKRVNFNNAQGLAPTANSTEVSSESSSGAPELSNCTSGNSENWMVLSVTGDKPSPRFNHAAAVVGNKMVVVGGESGNKLLDDVQVLHFDRYSWSTASSKLYNSPTSLPLKIPVCKGHALVSWGKKVLLVGGRTDPASDKVSVWSFDTETECWSLVEAKGDIPVARSGHTVVRASANLIMFGGEDTKRRKLNDLHMFDLKSFTWLPLHCTGPRPSPRSHHVATIYDDKSLLIFGGSSKSRTLNDLHSLDFETMVWSRIKIRGFHPSPRAGCGGALYGSKWYIVGGGSKKKRRSETLVLDVIKFEWSVAVTSPSSSITTNKGFSLVLWQHKEKDYLFSFGGFKKDLSDQVEVLTVERNNSSVSRRSTLSKVAGSLLSENLFSSTTVDSVARQNIASAIEHHGSGRRSLSESLLCEHPGSSSGNVSLRKQFHDEEGTAEKGPKFSEDGSSHKVMDQKVKQHDAFFAYASANGDNSTAREPLSASEPGNVENHRRQGSGSFSLDSDEMLIQESDGKSSMASNVSQFYEGKLASVMRKNEILEGQLGAALSGRELAERNLSAALKGKQEMEKKLADANKELDLLKEKLSSMEMAQDEGNNLSNMVHSDNVRLEHDVAFLKAVFDDTQKELLSTRGVLAGERARAFQLQVEVFHLKQRLQSLENRTPTPRKPYHA